MKKIITAIALFAVALCGAAMAAEMSVQVKQGQLRETPTFFGKLIDNLEYGDRVEVEERKKPWMRIRSGRNAGWIHESALTRKEIIMKAGRKDVEAAASGEELALAGKGFNAKVEAEFKANNRDVDYTWVDKMEEIEIDSSDAGTFLDQGGVSPAGGGR